MKILLMLMLAIASMTANAQDTARAWISAGESCEGGTKLEYQAGVPFKVSVCAQWPDKSCGFTIAFQSQPGRNTQFRILSRTLHPSFSDSTSTVPTAGLPITDGWPTMDLGGTGNTLLGMPYDGLPLSTVTIIADDSTFDREALTLHRVSTLAVPGLNWDISTPTCAYAQDAWMVTTPIVLDKVTAPAPQLPQVTTPPIQWPPAPTPAPPAPASAPTVPVVTPPPQGTTTVVSKKAAPQKRQSMPHRVVNSRE